MILSWALFPLVLAAVGLGWGALVEWAAGEQKVGVLAIPLGLAAALVVAAIFTAFKFSAPAAAPVVSVGALAGLARAWRRTSLAPPALVAALGALLIYGAPVILSGQATFLGYVRLDDTATWLGFIDQFFAHGRAVPVNSTNTYGLLLYTNLTQAGYPSGSFMLPGVGHWITGIDVAWIFQPYLAVCAGALAICSYELIEPVVSSRWLRALVAFVAAQSALLFGYAAWGGIKELTAAFLLALGMTAAARLLAAERIGARAGVPVAVAGAALIVTIGPGVVVYIGPAVLVGAAVLLWRALRGSRGVSLNVLAAVPLAGALALPAWLTLGPYLTATGSFTAASSSGGANQVHSVAYGNLTSALRAIQLGGIWLDGDFRSTPTPPSPSLINHLLIYVVFAGAIFAVAATLWRRRGGLALYLGVALASIAVLSLLGSVPWLMGKSLAISSPAVLLAGLTGGAILFATERVAAVILGALVLGAITLGVLWSNYLQYHNVTLAPRARLSEFQTIASLSAGKGPAFINEYEIYADRHFLRNQSPVEPAEYRPVDLPTLGNAFLTDSAWANIDSFAAATLAPYRTLVIRRGPTEGQPWTIYGRAPVWTGRYYSLWEQPATQTTKVLDQVPFGDITSDAYCGNASNVTPVYQPLCPIRPAGVPACATVHSLAAQATADRGELVAFERPNPLVVRAVDTHWSGAWSPDSASGTLTAAPSGGESASWPIVLTHAVRGYTLWLGGTFGRPFVATIDGRVIGSAFGLNPPGTYDQIGQAFSLAAGAHTVTITYTKSNLSPGSADSEYYSSMFAIALAPPDSLMHYVEVSPSHAQELCGHSLDWIEIVAAS
jgi:hypothetical protein